MLPPTLISKALLLFYGLAGGILPVLLWLWFWLHEDNKHPEPRRLIVYTFLAGMVTVPLVVPFQLYFNTLIHDRTTVTIVWAAVEELLKFILAYAVALRTKDDDEPIDPVVYMVTAALGFAAIENFLFIMNPLFDGNVLLGIVTGDLRFIGATLVHVASSAAVGIALGLSFYKPIHKRVWYLCVGMSIAVALHSLFNLFILFSKGERMFMVFHALWLIVLFVILFFERLKAVRPEIPQESFPTTK